jgi:hypothetical protein
MNLVINLKLYSQILVLPKKVKAPEVEAPAVVTPEVSKAQLSMQNRLPFQ